MKRSRDRTADRAVERFEAVIRLLNRQPVLVGHSFGGMLAQLLAGRGLAAANFNPWTEASVNTAHPDRGPLLIVSGELDHTVPRAVAHAAYQQQVHNPAVTEFVEMPGRGHALTIDSGWREVARTALSFIQRFIQP